MNTRCKICWASFNFVLIKMMLIFDSNVCEVLGSSWQCKCACVAPRALDAAAVDNAWHAVPRRILTTLAVVVHVGEEQWYHIGNLRSDR